MTPLSPALDCIERHEEKLDLPALNLEDWIHLSQKSTFGGSQDDMHLCLQKDIHLDCISLSDPSYKKEGLDLNDPSHDTLQNDWLTENYYYSKRESFSQFLLESHSFKLSQSKPSSVALDEITDMLGIQVHLNVPSFPLTLDNPEASLRALAAAATAEEHDLMELEIPPLELPDSTGMSARQESTPLLTIHQNEATSPTIKFNQRSVLNEEPLPGNDVRPTPNPVPSAQVSPTLPPCPRELSNGSVASDPVSSIENASIRSHDTSGVLISSTTKKSATLCKYLPPALPYPPHLIPLNAPIQSKIAAQSGPTHLASHAGATSKFLRESSSDPLFDGKVSSKSAPLPKSRKRGHAEGNKGPSREYLQECSEVDGLDDGQSGQSHTELGEDDDDSNLDKRELKRIKNTLSARKSRARKAAKIDFLEQRVNDLEAELARLRRVEVENQTLRAQLDEVQLKT
jgi:hypothetical protein